MIYRYVGLLSILDCLGIEWLWILFLTEQHLWQVILFFFLFLLLGHFYFIWGLNLRFDDFLCWLYLNLLGMSKTGYIILVLGFLGRTYDLVHAMQLYVHGMVGLRNWLGFNVTQAISFILSWPSYLNAFRNLVWNCSLNYI